jgi:putative heme-binding domain-containing protein
MITRQGVTELDFLDGLEGRSYKSDLGEKRCNIRAYNPSERGTLFNLFFLNFAILNSSFLICNNLLSHRTQAASLQHIVSYLKLGSRNHSGYTLFAPFAFPGTKAMTSRKYAQTLASLAGFAAVMLMIAAARSSSTADEPKAETKRKPWTTSMITGSPEPPPKFKAARLFPDVKFHHPLLVTRCPGTDRLFVGEQEGVLYSVNPGPAAKKELFFDLRKDLKLIDKLPTAKGLGEMYGLVFHPKFTENQYCYICYTLTPKDGSLPRLPDGSRVSRFTVTKTDPPRIDPASEEIVITFAGGGHNGGDLHFGPDGMLYISTGDSASPNPPDPLNTGQDCSDLLSSVLRIDVDHHDSGKNYAVPKENPFVGMKDVRPEIWAYGFRNPWRMGFDRQTGDLWVGDVGWELWESVHKVEKGGNYGWSIMEARQPIKPNQKIGPTPIRPPMIELPHTIAASVTGGYVYRGKKFPELGGAYIFGDWETRRIWAARFEGDRLKEMPEIVKPSLRVVAFGEDHAGELYFLDYDGGTMHTLERNDAGGANTKFPTKLSETGLFADVKKLIPAEGVIPFSPNARQWQDGTTAEYLIALPGLSSVKLFDKPRPLPGQVFWHDFKMQFPKDTVLVKTLILGPLPAKDGSKNFKMLETQILHHDGEDWHGYTYAWREDRSDADLVAAEGAEKVFQVPVRWDEGKKRDYVWTFHSRTQCMTCHNAWSEYALGFNVGQLNGPQLSHEGQWVNNLIRFSKECYVQRIGKDDTLLPPFDEKSAAKEVALVTPVSSIVRLVNGEPQPDSLEQRARSYLHANCAHCHRFGGGGGSVVLELDISKPLKETGILDARPKQGDFGIADARIVAAGDPGRSILLYRMAKFGRGRMPHLGSEWPDIAAIELMNEWICTLGGKAVLPPADNTNDLDAALREFKTALPFFRGFLELDKDNRLKLLNESAKLETGPVRDLFEGYLPPDPKGRKLGSNPRPSTILALTGDTKKGEELFLNKDLKCMSCHKIGDKGTAIGPELTTIGKTRSRSELLESMLQPSLRVEPQFAAYNVKTLDGRTFTGLLIKRDDKEVILKDGENKTITLTAADVESVSPSRLSLMPDGLIAGLTPQEAADLIDYLLSRKLP